MSPAISDAPLAANSGLDSMVELAASGRMEGLFATPIYCCVPRGLEALNVELRDQILAQEREEPSMVKSNQGGWQSTTDPFTWGGTAVQRLRQLAGRAVEVATSRLPLPPGTKVEFYLSGWAAVNRKGHYNTTHVHPMAAWSGIYYVDPGDESPETQGGVLELVNPSMASVMTFFPGLLPSARLVRPEPGMFILFPGYLQHSVRLYQGNRPRICVPFNAQVRTVHA
jgi:uncharacterized protein (TIGR02466 family)